MKASTTSTPERLARTPDPGDDAAGAARIGPNAVLQLVEALRARGHGDLIAPLFSLAGAGAWLSAPPGEMVDERRVARLHHETRAALSPPEAEAVMTEAGRRTADYLLAHRIPRLAQGLLKLLPARLAATALTGAIRANAWTFAGSGGFEARVGRTVVFVLEGNPLCAGETSPAPMCAWHAAVFERLFRVLVSPRARCRETQCEAAGGSSCRFEVDWRA